MKVRSVEAPGGKSIQEQEIENQKKLEEKLAAEGKGGEGSLKEVNEEAVLSFLKEKHGKEFSSVDELLKPVEVEKEVIKEVEKEVDIPEDIKALMEYRKTTGRTIQDFAALNRDVDAMSDSEKLREYLTQSNPHLTREEIDFEVGQSFKEEEDFESDDDYRRSVIDRKNKVLQATKFLNDQKSKYKEPVQRAGNSLSEEIKKKVEAFDKYTKDVEAQNLKNKERNKVFAEKTDKLFGEGFKGFSFKVNDEKEVVFNPGDAEEVKKAQSSPFNFVNKFLNKEGVVDDAEGYHKSLSAAMNAEAFAKHFYEAGKAAALEEVEGKTKNMDIRMRPSHGHVITQKSGFRAAESQDTSLKVRARKN